jgi:predicted enzyme related to lactoylglutathione lyase
VAEWLAPWRWFWSSYVDALERYLERMDKPKQEKAAVRTYGKGESGADVGAQDAKQQRERSFGPLRVPQDDAVVVIGGGRKFGGVSKQRRSEMKIKLASLYVDDQEKALRFYTTVLGFVKKADFSQGPFRWLTVASAEEPNGTELQLALNNNPPAKAYQEAIFQQGQPALMLFTDDVKSDYERMKGLGAEFTMPPSDVGYATIAMVKDTCGNILQLNQLKRH